MPIENMIVLVMFRNEWGLWNNERESVVGILGLWNNERESVVGILRDMGIEPGAFTRTFLK